MTIDKVICRDFKSNPIINYDIFMNHILPYIDNIYLNNKEKNKRIVEIFKNDTKKYIIEAFGKNYQYEDFYDEYPKEDHYYGIRFLDTDIDEDHDVNNDITIGIQSKTKKNDIDELENIIYNENEISCYHLEIRIWLKNNNLTNNSIKILKNYLKSKLNKKINNTKLTYFEIDKLEKHYAGGGQIICTLNIEYKFDKLSDEWKQFKKILIEENFLKRNIDNTIEINILKNIFLDKILSIFN